MQVLFYSDSLPFADQAPAPRAQGKIGSGMFSRNPDGSLCSGVDFILMTDITAYGDTGDGICIRSDSIVYFNYQGSPDLHYIYEFEIRPWTGKIYTNISKDPSP